MNGVRTLLRGLAKREDIVRALDEIEIGDGETFLVAHPEAAHMRKGRAGHCTFCGERVNVNTALRFESGWAKPRSEGGTNALALREVHADVWACSGCIDKQKRGIPPGQASLM